MRRDDGSSRGHRLERGQTERLDEARLTDDVGRGDPARYVLMWDAACERDPLPTLERFPQRPVTDERKDTFASPLECACEPGHVLPLREPPEAEEGRAVAAPADLRARFGSVSRGEADEVDSAVDDLCLASCVRDCVLELPAEPLRHGNDRRCSSHERTACLRVRPAATRVANVLPVRSDHERAREASAATARPERGSARTPRPGRKRREARTESQRERERVVGSLPSDDRRPHARSRGHARRAPARGWRRRRRGPGRLDPDTSARRAGSALASNRDGSDAML